MDLSPENIAFYNSEYSLPEDNKDLLEECDVFTFRSSGKGGQHVNKTESAVRLVHRPTGIVVLSRKERSQYLNKKECLIHLRQKLEKRLKIEEPRIPTKVSQSVKKKRRENKILLREKKTLRKKDVFEE